MLGLPEHTPWVDIASPFRAEQLKVRLVNDVSTRFHHRRESLLPVTNLMARQYAEKPGNYLCFVSSFEYLQQLIELFQARYPAIPA